MRHGSHEKDDRSPVVIRQPGPHDAKELWSLAGVAGLDVNSPYAYVMLADLFRDTSLVARSGEVLGGFVLGFRLPADPATVFVWQIAVAPELRGQNLGSTLLDALVGATGATAIEATVTPSNEASDRLFRSLGTRHSGATHVTAGYDSSLFAGDHEPEQRYRIDLRPTGRVGAAPARGETQLGHL